MLSYILSEHKSESIPRAFNDIDYVQWFHLKRGTNSVLKSYRCDE